MLTQSVSGQQTTQTTHRGLLIAHHPEVSEHLVGLRAELDWVGGDAAPEVVSQRSALALVHLPDQADRPLAVPARHQDEPLQVR